MATMTTMTSTTVSEQDPIAELQGLAAVLRITRAGIDEMAVQAHDTGHSWVEVGQALGVTPKTARFRYAERGRVNAERAHERMRQQYAQWKRTYALLAQITEAAAAMR